MILAKQPSIEDNKTTRELIAHIEPADDEILSSIDSELIDDLVDEDEDEESALDDKDE